MPVDRLTVYAYQDLIDQGWRRAGCYLYKPDLARSCCKAYTIRLDVTQFSPDKGQRRLLRKWRRFLEGETTGGSGEAAAGTSAGAGSAAVSATDLPMATNDDGEDDTPGAPAPGQGQARHTLGWQNSAAERARNGPRCAPAAEAAAAVAAADPAADPGEQALQQLLAAALAAAVAAGDLPVAGSAAQYPPPAVHRCSNKQRASLPADVRYTSAAAFRVAAAIARGKAAAAGGVGGGANAKQHASGGTDAPAGDTAGGGGPRQRDAQRKAAAPLLEGALSAAEVANVLVRHFNAVAESSGWAPSGGAAAAEGENGRGPAQAEHVAGRPEAYAASGHVNIRLPTAALTPAPQCGAAGAAPASGFAGTTVAAAGAVGSCADGRGCSGSGASTSGGGGGAATAAAAGECSDGAAGGGKPTSRRGTPGGAPRAGMAPADQAKARSPPGVAAAPAAAGGRGSAGPGPGPDSLAMPGGRLEIRLVPSQFILEEFELYKRYQVAQHGDKPWQLSRTSYTHFLVDSPLPRVGRDRDPAAPECGYGSFHQQYWLDGKLIAVGVVDVLPRCLSSVYFFWDTGLGPLALGRFSALQEILWVRRALASSPGLHYYYMGFYIHTCPKMRYKAEYRPSDLLCPLRKVWVRITPQLLAAISQRPFLELSAEEGALCQPNLAAPQPGRPPAAAEGEDEGEDGNVGETLVLLPQEAARMGPVPFEVLRRHNIFPQRAMQAIEQAIRTWRAAVGWTAPVLVYQL